MSSGRPQQVQDDVGGVCQFTSILLVYQGVAGLDGGDVALVVPQARKWCASYRGSFAGETSERVYLTLTGDMMQGHMNAAMKQKLEGPLCTCGRKGCRQTTQDDGEELKQCGRFVFMTAALMAFL